MANKAVKLPRTVPSATRKRFERRAEALGQHGGPYLALVGDLIGALRPEDPIEYILLQQAADNASHTQRLRQIEAALLAPHAVDDEAAERPLGLSNVEMRAALHREHLVATHGYKNNVEYMKLRDLYEPDMHREEKRLREEEAQNEILRKQEIARRRNQLLAEQADTPASLTAAYSKNGPDLERIGRQIALAESRFTTSVKEFERYRLSRRPPLQNLGAVVDAEFTEVPDEQADDLAPTKRRQPAQRAFSTGPRTRAGKQKASQNALRHGLAITVSRHPALAEQARNWASELSAEWEGRVTPGDLLPLSETNIDLDRIQRVRSFLLDRITAAVLPSASGPGSALVSDGAEEAIRDLAALDRYERRALSRQRAALRALAPAVRAD